MSVNKKSESPLLSLYKNILSLSKEIKESILIDTNSEPFNHQKYLPAVLKPLQTGENVIRPLKNNRLRFLTAFFLSNPQNQIQLYLNKKGFEEMYCVLKGKKAHPNLQIIVSSDVLKNEKKELFEQLPFQMEDNLKKMIPPRLSDLKSKESVLIVDTDEYDLDIPSFAIINNRHTLIQNEEEGGFLIHFNAYMGNEGQKQVHNKKNAFAVLTEIATPYQEITPTLIAKSQPFNMNASTNQNFKGA